MGSIKYNAFFSHNWMGGSRTLLVPVSQTLTGKAYISRLTDLQKQGAIFNCLKEAGTCSTVIRAGIQEEPVTEVLAVCEVYVIENRVSAPENCRTIAITGRPPWILAAVEGARSLQQPPACPTDQGWGRPEAAFRLFAAPDKKESIVNAVQAALSNEPFGFETQILRGGVVGRATRRLSPILTEGPRYREIVTVRIDVEEARIPSCGPGARQKPPLPLPFFDLVISQTLFVNAQNTEDPSDWHQPTASQSERYRQMIRQQVKSALTSACKMSAWRGETMMLCDLPASTTIPDSLRLPPN
jgi:hypothetical protein